MPEDCGWTDLSCQAQQSIHDGLDDMARDAGQSNAHMIMESFTWWLQTPSVDPNSPAVWSAQGYTWPVVVVLLMTGVLIQSGKMIAQRKPQPILDVAVGLLKFAMVSSMGLMLLAGALKAGDALCTTWMDTSIHDFSTRLRDVFAPRQSPPVGAPVPLGDPFLLIIVSTVGMLISAVQWVLMFLRNAGIMVLAALLYLAASASMLQLQWLRRIGATLAGLVAYKPLAALIYVIGMTLLSQGNDLQTAMTGLAVIVIAAIALPTVMSFFSFTGLTGSSGGGGALGAAAGAFAGSGLGGGSGGGGPSGAADRDSSVAGTSRTEHSGPGSGPHGADPSAGQPGGATERGPSEQGAADGAASGMSGPEQGAADGPAAHSSTTSTASGAAGASSAVAGGLGAAAAGADYLQQGTTAAGQQMTGEADEQQ